MNENEFCRRMLRDVPEEARVMLCQFRGDPGADLKGKWRASVLRRPDQIDQWANVYLCVSAMKKNERGEFRRRKENFAAGLLLMIDDIGTGIGSKFPMSLLDALAPTGLIETSRDNFQAVYFFDQPITDIRLFQRLITAFIAEQFLGNDPGMAGVNRVFRPPAGTNGKPKHDGWRVLLHEWAPERQYSPQALVDAFGLTLEPAGRRDIPRGATVDKAEAIRAFISVRGALASSGMLKRDSSDRAGWQDLLCPWTSTHTGGVDNGAAIREPDEANAWAGAFKCHHGSCADRHWRDLTQWLAEEHAEVLLMINNQAAAGRTSVMM